MSPVTKPGAWAAERSAQVKEERPKGAKDTQQDALPPGPLGLTRTNADVYSVHLPDGAHVGNLKRIGTIWKFKAVGYDDAGQVEPGGGPLTLRHNTVLTAPDAAELNAALSATGGLR